MKDKQEESEKERTKYFLLINGLRKRRKLERPFHVMNLAKHFIEETLELKVFNEKAILCFIIYVIGHQH